MPNADRKPGSTRKAGDSAGKPAGKAAKSAGLRADGTPRRSNHRDKPAAPRRAAPSRDGDFDRYASDRAAPRAAGGRTTSTGRAGTTGRTSTTSTGRTSTTGSARTTSGRTATGTGRTATGTGRTATGRTSTTTGRTSAGTGRAGASRDTASTGRGTAGRATTARAGAAAPRATTGRAAGDGPRAAGTARTGGRPITSTGRNVGGRGATGGDVWGSPRAAAGAKGAGTASRPVKKTATKAAGTKAGAAKAPKPVAAPALKRVRPPSGSVSVRKPTDRPDAEVTPGELERLQKVLAQAGIGSRRASEELIAAGRVTVDGVRAELGDRVDAVNSVIHVDGERIVTDDRKVYLAMNKPAGVVATMADEKGRAALADFLGNVPQRVYHVGRLDSDSEGLLLLTNDGTLAHKLMHPSYNVPKTYLAEVPGPVRTGLRKQLMDGVELEDGPVSVDGFRLVDSLGGRVLVELVLHEGRKHVVRRLMAEVGHPVSRLVRTSIGPIKLGDLKAGRTRRLTRPEIAALFKVVGD